MIRKKEVLSLTPKPPCQDGQRVTVQTIGAVLILNCYRDRKLLGRWCMDTDTGRYLIWDAASGYWAERKLQTVFGYDTSYWSDCQWYEKVAFDSREDEGMAGGVTAKSPGWPKDTLQKIQYMEEEYNRDKKMRAETGKEERRQRLMSRIPPLPEDFAQWIHKMTGKEDYLFSAQGGKGRWICTACGGTSGGDPEKNEGDILTCPCCGKRVRHMGKKRVVRRQARAVLLQDLGGNESVSRHIDTRIIWDNHGRRIEISEGIRLILRRKYRSRPCVIYYSQNCKSEWIGKEDFLEINPANRRFSPGYLYPEGIREALAGTVYEGWVRVFEEAAGKGLNADYNLAMCMNSRAFIQTCEYLVKGRFYRLLAESFSCIYIYGRAEYAGVLDMSGDTIEEVFRIRDRQKINRIRDLDGGEATVRWMRWSEESGKKLSQEFLSWAAENNVNQEDLNIETKITPEKAMNYIRRQNRESYPNKTGKQTLEQWRDYLSMCRKLGKDLTDPMICLPRELKRRHDEAVEELRKIQKLEMMRRSREQAEEQERKMRERYPGAEENLEEIRGKYEYESGKYKIIVPHRLSEIALEGYALHHCAGSSERYYERIMRHETYICFLRKTSEPDVPFYTIEVEPGGTIRQHRSMYDKEPGIKEIRGFLREWQQVIRQRMKTEDHRRAGVSRQLREDNIRQLKEANNTRVLRGLMEDFMAAEDEAAPEAI